jgi:O-acetyl-ADP-ribose deacetylase (regulator of RNase III)
MTNLIHAQGNLLDMAEAGNFDLVIQGCNCFNAMGSGIAREIRERYPYVAEVDSLTRRGDYTKLGTWTESIATSLQRDESSIYTIINAYTQYNMSTGQDVFEYLAFQLILQKIAYIYPTKRIGLPYIGMGLAGGDKNRIIPMIENFADKMMSTGGSVTLVEFK